MDKNEKEAEKAKARRRRNDAKRMLRHAYRVSKAQGWGWGKEGDELEAYLWERAKYHRDHLKKCSCWMCGNPRQNGGITLQEEKHLRIAKEQIKELDEPEDIDISEEDKDFGESDWKEYL